MAAPPWSWLPGWLDIPDWSSCADRAMHSKTTHISQTMPSCIGRKRQVNPTESKFSRAPSLPSNTALLLLCPLRKPPHLSSQNGEDYGEPNEKLQFTGRKPISATEPDDNTKLLFLS